MAKVAIDWRELRDDKLPWLCVRCGAPAEDRLHKTFRWLPWWRPLLAVVLGVLLLPVGLIPLLGRAIYQALLRGLTQPLEMEMQAPVCPAHRNHWGRRTLLHWGCFFVLVAAFVLGLVLRQGLSPWFWRGLGGLATGWVAVGLVARQTMTRAVRITGTTLTLVGVAPEFAEGLAAGRSARSQGPGRETARRSGTEGYRVVGILPDGQKQLVATFVGREEAQECAHFLGGGAKFQRVEVEGPAA